MWFFVLRPALVLRTLTYPRDSSEPDRCGARISNVKGIDHELWRQSVPIDAALDVGGNRRSGRTRRAGRFYQEDVFALGWSGVGILRLVGALSKYRGRAELGGRDAGRRSRRLARRARSVYGRLVLGQLLGHVGNVRRFAIRGIGNIRCRTVGDLCANAVACYESSIRRP